MTIESGKRTVIGKVTALAGRIRPRGWRRWALAGGLAAVAAGTAVVLIAGASRPDAAGEKLAVYEVARGSFTVKITESGDIKSLHSNDIKSEVEGRTTIISIVEEGTFIKPEDVNNVVLVELDSSQIRQRLTQQEISYLSAEASYAEARESLEIQKKQNESDIKAGEIKVRFAIMDLQKYVGDHVGDGLLAMENPGQETGEIAALVADANLGGEALQKLRELQSDIDLNKQELTQAETTLEWTKKLYDKSAVPYTDVEADTLNRNRKRISLDKSVTARELFIRYEFPKDLEKRVADYQEAQRELERVRASARAKLAQAQARLESNKAQYEVQKEQLAKLRRQLTACTIKAPATGQVVYASSIDRWMRQNTPIQAGADIYERQKIISIPDPCGMKVEIKIHEAWVDKVHIGQKATISIPAFPERSFTGRVARKSPLADQTNFWLNPDLKVYVTDVSMDGTHNFLKTGMTAKVEIVIEQIDNVLSVPIQAVVNDNGKKVCYVLNEGSPVRREVVTGSFNENFVVIKSGLSEGEKVLLNPPRAAESS